MVAIGGESNDDVGVQGVKNNIPAVLAILRSEPFRAGRVHTGLIAEVLAKKS